VPGGWRSGPWSGAVFVASASGREPNATDERHQVREAAANCRTSLAGRIKRRNDTMTSITLKAQSAEEIVELSEAEIDKVTGGRKAGGEQQDYLVVKIEEVIVTS